MSECYLMHLFAPVCSTRPARHYLGFSANTVKREEDYRRGRVGYHGRLMLAAYERGIDFVVARVWKNADKRDEKRLRDLAANPRLCPICNPSLALETRLNAAGRYQTYPTTDPKRLRYGDLRLLRDRPLRPARARIRRDGTSNGIEPIALAPADLELIDQRRRSFEEVVGAFGVPADLIGFDADLPY